MSYATKLDKTCYDVLQSSQQWAVNKRAATVVFKVYYFLTADSGDFVLTQPVSDLCI